MNKTHKKRRRMGRKTQKNKQRKHRKGGMPRIGPFGKQKPLDSNNKPKNGDKVRVNGVAGYTVITPMNRQAEVCPPGKVDTSKGFAMCKVEPEIVLYDNITKHGFVESTKHKYFKGGRRKRKSRKTKKRGGDTQNPQAARKRKLMIEKLKVEARKVGEKKAFQKEWDRTIGENVKKTKKHFDVAIKGNIENTLKAMEDREKREKQFEKLAMSRPPRVASVKDTNILGMERSPEKIENLTRKKQKKSDKKFYNTLMSEMNTVLTDKTHPNHFNERRKRILNLIKQKDPNSYREICGFTNPSQSNTGCSMRMYEKIEPNGEKRGDDLLNAIQEHYVIKDKDVLIRKKGGKRKTRKRRRKRSKTRKRR